MGLLCQSSNKTDEIRASYGTILSKLEPLFHQHEASLNDNAAGCVSRMILRHPDKVPLDEVIPVLVEGLPLRSDYGENEVVWQMIIKLCKHHFLTFARRGP